MKYGKPQHLKFQVIISHRQRHSSSHKVLFNRLRPCGKYMSHMLLKINNYVFCIYVFRMTLSVNSDYFLKQH
jgi:hypothetical protein